MKGRKKRMYIILGIIFTLLLIVLFLKLPFSFVQQNFMKSVNLLIRNSVNTDALFTEEDIKDLPEPLQKYFHSCGYLGTRKMNDMKAVFKNVTFRQGRKSPDLIIDYTQYNFINRPDRMALISSSLYGIPFEGCDSYINGIGRMKGVVAKVIPIFNVTGKEMDKACLVTFLADSFMMPNAFLQDYIKWENVDANHAKAIISYYGISASGIFTFNDIGEITAFTTKDRAVYNSDGSMSYEQWTITCEAYEENANGIKYPTKVKAVWNYEDGDFTYFDSSNLHVEYH